MLKALLQSSTKPHEWQPMLRLISEYKKYKASDVPLQELANSQDDLQFCYSTLAKVSRSFSVVIQQLPRELRDAVCLFYLILRALDSIEDDTSVDVKLRISLLEDFHNYLEVENWYVDGVGDKPNYRVLLLNFPKVARSFKSLDPKYKKVIKEICRKMGQGMIQFLDKEIVKVKDYDLYCYYVAGLVGVGLSELFSRSGLQSAAITKRTDLSIAMGLFLQKTNIIRDYLEDLNENRTFWPKEIWSVYSNRLDEFSLIESKARIHCLNHMVCDALRHVPQCLQYLKELEDPMVFNFCAIPQVMAIATLTKLFGNEKVYSENVKIRKGKSAYLIFNSKDYASVSSIFKQCATDIFQRLTIEDPLLQLEINRIQAIVVDEEINNKQYLQNLQLPYLNGSSEIITDKIEF